PMVVVKSPVTEAPKLEYEPPESEPPDKVDPLIVPNPEMVGLLTPVILPVALKAAILLALSVFTPKVPWVPLSVKVRSVFGVASASLIAKTPLVPAVASVKTGLLAESVNGFALERVNA